MLMYTLFINCSLLDFLQSSHANRASLPQSDSEEGVWGLARSRIDSGQSVFSSPSHRELLGMVNALGRLVSDL